MAAVKRSAIRHWSPASFAIALCRSWLTLKSSRSRSRALRRAPKRRPILQRGGSGFQGQQEIEARGPEEKVRGPGGERRRKKRVVAERLEGAEGGPIDDGDDDADPDAVEGAAPRHHERKGDAEQGHDQAD